MRKALKAINWVVLAVWLLSAISLDSVSWLPIIVCACTTLYLGAYVFIKYGVLEEVL